MSTATRRFEDVTPGETLPEIAFEITLPALVIYAAATWDFHRLHYDVPFAEAAGMRAPIMDGQMAGGLLARQLMRWGGADSFVRRLSFRLRTPAFLGERIRLRGAVTGLDEVRALALCMMDILKEDGKEVVRAATGAVELPRRAG
jgi:acyl dehydratase